MKGIIDADCKHGKRIWENFRIHNPGQYHDLYVQNDRLLLADLLESFGNKSIELCVLDPASGKQKLY